jgi:hypothetical protein
LNEGIELNCADVIGECHRVTVLWLPYILVTVCTDIVTVRIRMTYSNCTAILAHGCNSCGYRTYWQQWNTHFISKPFSIRKP